MKEVIAKWSLILLCFSLAAAIGGGIYESTVLIPMWSKSPPSSLAAAAVRALYQQLMDGWNQGSGEAFAAPFAEDGDLVAFDGTHFTSRGFGPVLLWNFTDRLWKLLLRRGQTAA